MEDTEPRVQRLFHGLYRETGVGPQGLAGAGLSVAPPAASLTASGTSMKKIIYGLAVLSVFLPSIGLAQTGTYFDPIYVQVQQDPFDAYVQQSQQQWQSDSYNQSFRNIQNAINGQTQQQAQFQQQQLYQQAAGRCPINSQPYVSKVSGKIGGCICNASYYMQDGVCVSVSAPQPTLPTKPIQTPGQIDPKTYVPANASNPATQLQQGDGSGGSTGLESCNRMVQGEMTYFGELTSDACYSTWQSAVEKAIGSNVAYKPVATQMVSSTVRTQTEAAFTASTSTPTPQIERRGFWAWLLGLFGR